MDDVTRILRTVLCITRLLKHLDELFEWANIKIKAAKSRSLLIRNGLPQIRNIFTVGGDLIPQLDKKPLQNLGRQYFADLSDKQMGKLANKSLMRNWRSFSRATCLKSIKSGASSTPCTNGSCGLWRSVKSHCKKAAKWTALLTTTSVSGLACPAAYHCFPGLFGQNMLELHIKPISLGNKQEKSCLVLELKSMGRKWKM